MSWVNDLASGLGIPAGAATLAMAMYAACSAAEKAARPEALQDIGRILKDPSWSRSVRPSAIVERVFVWTFGERHLTRKCFQNSMLASLLFCIVIALTSHQVLGWNFLMVDIFWLAVAGKAAKLVPLAKVVPATLMMIFYALTAFLSLVVPTDFVALAKTRFLLRCLRTTPRLPIVCVVLLDPVTSVLISYGLIFSIRRLIDWMAVYTPGTAMDFLSFSVGEMMYAGDTGYAVGVAHSLPELSISLKALLWAMYEPFVSSNKNISFAPIFLFSTLFTSMWTTLILLSTITLKLLAPLQGFTSWFFDVHNHPVQAIGIVSGALVMAGALFWTALRAIF